MYPTFLIFLREGKHLSTFAKPSLGGTPRLTGWGYCCATFAHFVYFVNFFVIFKIFSSAQQLSSIFPPPPPGYKRGAVVLTVKAVHKPNMATFRRIAAWLSRKV